VLVGPCTPALSAAIEQICHGDVFTAGRQGVGLPCSERGGYDGDWRAPAVVIEPTDEGAAITLRAKGSMRLPGPQGTQTLARRVMLPTRPRSCDPQQRGMAGQVLRTQRQDAADRQPVLAKICWPDTPASGNLQA